jgi:hypothetical protein
MDFPIWLNKFIIDNRYLRYSSFWWWYKLMAHSGFRFDDHHICGSFWSSLNGGWHDIQYKYEFEKFWGRGAKPETIVLSKEDFDALQERLNEPPDPKVVERFREILAKPAPWDDDYDTSN